MSEDLRYYFFDNEAEPEPPISPEEGWMQMEQLLDQHLPAKKRRVAALWPYAVAASLLLIAIVSVFYLREGAQQKTIVANKLEVVPATNSTSNTTALVPSDNTLLPSNDNNAKHLNDNSSSIVAANPATAEHRINERVIEAHNNLQSSPGDYSNKLLNTSDKADNTIIAENNSLQSTENKANTITGTTIDNSNPLAVNEKINKPQQSTLPADNLPIPSLKKQDDKNKKGSWNFSAGVGVNMATAGNTQSLQPYPVAETKYNISKRVYIAAAIAPYAPATASASGIDKSVMVNDLSRNVSRYDERTTYTRVNYLDIPLMAGVNVTKNFSVQGGVQVSYMLNNRSAKTYETYDLTMNRIAETNVADASFTPAQSLGTLMEKTNELNVRKTDYRYVAGVQYTLKKATFGLQYQQGFQPVLNGTNVTGRKNNLLSLKVNFRIK